MTVRDAILALLVGSVFVGLPLLKLYLEERVKNVAKEESDRAMAAIQADHQRSLEEFGLYARKRHEVYAELYGKYRRAADAYAGLVGFIRITDFLPYTRSEAEEFCKGNKVGKARTAPILAAYDVDNKAQAVKLLEELERDVKRWSANRLYQEARNYEALNELYLSDAVRSQLDLVRAKISNAAVHLEDDDEERDPHSLERRDAMQGAMGALFKIMRDELRRGDTTQV